ncbi:MAG TPA: hypothetical protein VGN83_15920 [Falsiroseomonas sp.]|jgi:hypothetical protein|nr:hypothetical protein [Falsiroseomonas sp.]
MQTFEGLPLTPEPRALGPRVPWLAISLGFTAFFGIYGAWGIHDEAHQMQWLGGWAALCFMVPAQRAVWRAEDAKEAAVNAPAR